MSDPGVSVIMSVFNSEKYLGEAVESILNQTHRDFEFIIVDDCSTDGSPDILNEYTRKDPRIRLLKNEKNLGLTKSLNRAISQAKGKYIARMDSDDAALEDRLARQVEFMEYHPDVVLLGTAFYEIDASGKELSRKMFPLSDREIRRILIKYNPFCHASVLIRRAALAETGPYDEHISKTQDYDLWFRLANKGRVANLSDFLMKRRYEGGNISISGENEQLRWAIRIRKDAIKKGYYSPANYIYLIRPFMALITPPYIRKAFRKRFLKNRMYS